MKVSSLFQLPRWVLLFLCCLVGLSAAADPTYYRIHNRWYQNEWLGEERGKAVCREGQGDGYLWRIEEKGGTSRLFNKATGHALQATAAGVNLCAVADEGSAAQGWTIEEVSGSWKAIRSEAGKYLNIEHRLGGPASDMETKPTDQDRWSGQWELVHGGGPLPPRAHARNQVSVVSPGYASDVSGPTKIELHAPGLKSVAVTAWKSGRLEKLAEVTLDDEGRGAFQFATDGFPKGPLTLKLRGTNGSESDSCFLQLYHTGGKTTGSAGAIPPQAKGMKVLFTDDFDRTLSISKDGKGATYAAHKPGGGDFSGIPFSDFEGPGNPFSQRDGFLRIRADEAKNTTGLLSSLRMDGTGITAKAPCYFECRFLAQSAPGTWPAFWVMTADTWKGMKTPVDELDVIEAYGGEGPGTPNAPGYEIASHYWNQGPGGEKDKSQPGVHKPILMTTLPGAKGSSWYEEFHTYGVRIGKDDTIYYCDDIEVGRHPTARLSKEQPFFFFINLAIGGTSGWKKDLSRYGGIADMHVDYVRVLQGE